jgi:hypothetical protein
MADSQHAAVSQLNCGNDPRALRLEDALQKPSGGVDTELTKSCEEPRLTFDILEPCSVIVKSGLWETAPGRRSAVKTDESPTAHVSKAATKCR